MTEPALSDVLDRAVAGKVVGPPRIDAIRSGAARRRLRRTTGVVGAAFAVLAVVGGTAFLTQGGASPIVSPGLSDRPGVSDPPVGGTRLVGIGHVAVGVPVGWGLNATSCSTPQRDTVIVGHGDVTECLARRPEGVDSIQIQSGKSNRFPARDGKAVEIGGVRAERQPTVCKVVDRDWPTVCSATVYFPTFDVTVRVESSTDGGAEVDRIVGWVVVVPDQVGVPEPAETAAKTAAELTALGLRPVVETRQTSQYLAGEVLGVSAAPGTVLPLGATVTVTVAGP